METKKEIPLEKQTKRDILQSVCTAKGWDIKSKIATSLNRASKEVLIEWHRDLI